jgi:hypothetical protein
MNVKIIAMLLVSICLSVSGNTLYKTSFETENEPFGAVTKANCGFAIPTKGCISKEISHSGKQSLDIGPGLGKYGKFCTKNFSPSLENKELWVQYYFYSKNDSESGYKSFLVLKGPIKDAGGVLYAISVFLHSNKVVASGKRFDVKLNAGWNKVKVKVNLEEQSYDLYINDTFSTPKIPFVSLIKSKATIKGISTILIGGGTFSIKTYIDDFYLATKDPELENSVPVVLSQGNKSAAKGFAMINKSPLPPTIDGKNDDKCWQQSSTLSPFLTGDGRIAEHQQTKAHITYDDKNMYVLLECFDAQLNPVLNQLSEIKANAKGRDSSVFKDDSIELFIATDPKVPSGYYHFAINTKGVIYDAKHPVPGASWNSTVSTKTAFNDKSWIMEVKIPLKELGISKPLNNVVWNINICRNKPSLGELSSWNPTFSSFHSYNNWGKVCFSNKQPAISCKLPKTLSEGSNYSYFNIKNPSADSYVIEDSIDYQNSDSVTTAQAFNVNSKKTSVKDEFIIHTKHDSRNYCRNCIASYNVKDKKTGRLLYSTPGIKYSLSQYSPFRTNFIAENSRIFYMCFKNMYIAKGSALHRLLLIQYAKDISGKFKECELVIDMPEYISIINPAGSGKKIKATKVKEVLVSSKGSKRRKYVFTFPERFTYPQREIGKGNPYNNKISFVFYCESANITRNTDTINYYTQAKVNGKTISESANKIPVTILPEIRGKMPQKILLISSFGGYNLSMSMLSEEEYKKCMENIANAGFNVFGITDYKELPFDNVMLKNIRSFGLKIEKAFFVKDKSWIKSIFPDSREYLKKYPQHRAVDGKGRTLDNVISISHRIDPKGEFRSIMKKHLSEIAKKYDIVLWDHEARQLGEESLCYNPQSLMAFKKYLKTDKSLTIEEVQNNYKEQWIKFQCLRNAELGKIMRDIVKKANPQCLFNIYSGYQSELGLVHYGIDWSLFGEFIDNAECGYRRPLTEVEATLEAVAPANLIPGELISVWVGNLEYDFSKLKVTMFRRLTDGNGGFLLFYDLQVDGRFWCTIGEISRLVADYESFFINPQKSKKSLKIISGITKDDIVVYENSKREKIIILFNSTSKNKKCELQVKNLPSKALMKDYYSGDVFDANNNFSVTINPFDVKVLIIKSQK